MNEENRKLMSLAEIDQKVRWGAITSATIQRAEIASHFIFPNANTPGDTSLLIRKGFHKFMHKHNVSTQLPM